MLKKKMKHARYETFLETFFSMATNTNGNYQHSVQVISILEKWLIASSVSRQL